MLKNKKGFTLSELMAVIVFIGILTAIAMPSYKSAAMKARIVNNMPLLRALQNDMINFYNLHTSLPTKLTQLSINKGEFTDFNGDKTSAKHIPTGCTISIKTTSNLGIEMDCHIGWTMRYSIVETSIGYAPGQNTFSITASGSTANSLQKIMGQLDWPQKPGNTTVYIMK